MSPEKAGEKVPQQGIHLIFCVILFAVAIAVYTNSMSNKLVWDDHDIVINNPVNRSLSNIGTIFSSADSTVSGHQHSYYRPLNRLTYAIDYQLYGLKPAGYHVENVLIHCANVLLVYVLLVTLFADPMVAFASALLFAVHPINAEAVNFVSGRNNLLATFFVMLSFLSYLKARSEGKQRYYALAGGLFFLGLLCKEIALMLVGVLFLYDISSFRDLREKFREKAISLAPFFLFTILYGVLRANALSAGGGLELYGAGERLLQNLYIVPKYLVTVFFPVDLNAYQVVPKDIWGGHAWVAAVWIACVPALYFLLKERNYVLRFGLLWAAVNFVPISNLVHIPSAAMADRYMYLTAIGIWIILGFAAVSAYRKFGSRKPLFFAGLAVVSCLALLTIGRNAVWRDDLSLFSNIVAHNPDTAHWHYALGLSWQEKGEMMKARAEWEKTVGLDPRYALAWASLGDSYYLSEDLDRAAYCFERALDADPDNPKTIYNLAKVEEKLGQPQKALYYYEAFLAKAPSRYAQLFPAVTARVEMLRRETGGSPAAKGREGR